MGTVVYTVCGIHMFRAGKVIYTQVGYLLKKDLLGDVGTLMTYASLPSADYDRLNDGINVIDIGVNWLIKAHTSKITLDYQNRPVFEAQGQDLLKVSTKGQFVQQYQVSF